MEGHRLKRVTTHRYLDAFIDHPVTWRPAFTNFVTSGRRVLSIIRKLGGRSWGGAQGSMLFLNHARLYYFLLPFMFCLTCPSRLHNEGSCRPRIVFPLECAVGFRNLWEM